MNNISQYLDNLIRELSRLPGMGPKSASRVAFHLLQQPQPEVDRLINAITDLKERVMTCSVCGSISDSEVCSICSSTERDQSTICVVEKQRDVLILEKTGVFKGLYHVLGGVISPLDGIGPQQLRISELTSRCTSGNVKEIILALNPTLEGDATALYLSNELKKYDVRVMRMARGLPAGADIEFSDNQTIASSFKWRIEV